MEPNDPGMVVLLKLLHLPRIMRAIYCCYLRYIRRDPLTADLVAGLYRKTTTEHFALVAQREAYRMAFFEAWQDAGIDFMLTAPNALPAMPLGGMKYGLGALGYTLLFNLVSHSYPLQKMDAQCGIMIVGLQCRCPSGNKGIEIPR